MKKRWLPRLGERPFEHRRGALQASKRPVTWLKGMTSARQKNIAASKKNAGDRTNNGYGAFSLLFLMAKAGEVRPLMRVIGNHPSMELRLAVIKLLALSGEPEIVPAFHRLAVRGSLTSELRSAVMEAISQIGSKARQIAPPTDKGLSY